MNPFAFRMDLIRTASVRENACTIACVTIMSGPFKIPHISRNLNGTLAIACADTKKSSASITSCHFVKCHHLICSHSPGGNSCFRLSAMVLNSDPKLIGTASNVYIRARRLYTWNVVHRFYFGHSNFVFFPLSLYTFISVSGRTKNRTDLQHTPKGHRQTNAIPFHDDGREQNTEGIIFAGHSEGFIATRGARGLGEFQIWRRLHERRTKMWWRNVE